MKRSFFSFLFIVLMADGLMLFLVPVMVYTLTESLLYSGITYTILWLPRLLLLPTIGHFIDNMGIKRVSIISDTVKIVGCLSLLFCILTTSNPLIIAVTCGLVGSLTTIGNAQTLIAYEKLISLLSTHIEKDVNILNRIDFLGMIAGSLIGVIAFDYGFRYLLILAAIFYLSNIGYFLFFTDIPQYHEDYNNKVEKSALLSIRFIITSPILIMLILMAMGNNMFDGLVEASGSYLMSSAMNLSIKYFALIDIVAGLFGVLGTYLYSFLINRINHRSIFIIGLSLIVIASSLLTAYLSHIYLFLFFYSMSILGKVFVGNFMRVTRIKIIPNQILASTSSLIVLLNQSILPFIGFFLFLTTTYHLSLSFFMIGSILLSAFSGGFALLYFLAKSAKINSD